MKEVGNATADSEGTAHAAFKVKVADQAVVDAQRMDKLHLPAFLAFFFQLLLGTVQQEALIKALPIFLNQFNAAHNVQALPVLVAHAVFHADGIAWFFQALYRFAEPFLIAFFHCRGNHLEIIGFQLFKRRISKYFKRSTVHAYDVPPIKRMA